MCKSNKLATVTYLQSFEGSAKFNSIQQFIQNKVVPITIRFGNDEDITNQKYKKQHLDVNCTV